MFTTASIGIAVGTAAHRSGDEVVRDADIAMYRAKAAGGDRSVVFDATMHDRAVRRLKLETELRRALERQQLQLYYQPIVSLATREVAGFEALLRWEHPTQGLLVPDAFLDVAHDAGLLTRIDQWVLTEACRFASRWRDRADGRPISVSVNISAPTFARTDFVEQVEGALRGSGLTRSTLNLELTESVAMPDPERTGRILGRLKGLGVTASLDDFGTGYSLLSYLQRFPVQALKIDRSFVQGIHDRDECRQIIVTVLQLAKMLALDVVAEGAETPDQVAYLDGLRCAFVQGFFFSKPLPPGEVDRLLTTGPPRRWTTAADGAAASSPGSAPVSREVTPSILEV